MLLEGVLDAFTWLEPATARPLLARTIAATAPSLPAAERARVLHDATLALEPAVLRALLAKLAAPAAGDADAIAYAAGLVRLGELERASRCSITRRPSSPAISR